MWTGRHGLRLFFSLPRRFLRLCVPLAIPACAAALLLTAQGCSSTSSTRELPALPVLKSLERLERNGTPGVWMDESDAGRLALWIYDVTGEGGQ